MIIKILFLLIIFSNCSYNENDQMFAEIIPDLETSPVFNPTDAADDPVIWYNKKDNSKSLILGTDKLGGLIVYNINGTIKDYLNDGKLNNVDVRYNFQLKNNDIIDIAIATNRSTNTLIIYKIDNDTCNLINITSPVNNYVLNDIYGLTLFKDFYHDILYAIVTSTTGVVDFLQIYEDQTYSGYLNINRIQSFSLSSISEGCVVDDINKKLYIAEENKGVWMFEITNQIEIPGKYIIDISESNLVADLEGLALLKTNSKTFLIISVHGDNSFAIYEIKNDEAFKIVCFKIIENLNKNIDKVTNTDGIDLINESISGTDFNNGFFIVQDFDNGVFNQNFKIVNLQKIKELLD